MDFKSPKVHWLLAAFLATVSPTALTQISFTDVSTLAGVDQRTESYGASWGDLNGDGYPDIYANNHRVRDTLFLNRGDGTFLETGRQVLTWVNHENGDTHGGTWADFDDDGDQDLVVSTGTGNSTYFLVNEYGRLIDRSTEFGTASPNIGGRLPVWLDYDRDGLLDFIMTQFGGIARVYRQNPTGIKFTETTSQVKLNCKKFHYGVLYDVNNDGRLDFICPEQDSFPQKIYDTFPFPWVKMFDITVPNGLFPIVPQVADSIVGDFNNDGRMDMFLLSGVKLRPSGVSQEGSFRVEAQLNGGIKGFKFITTGPVTFELDWNKADEGTVTDLDRIEIGAGGFHPTAIPFTLDPTDPNVAGMSPAPAVQSDLPVMRIGYEVAAKRWTLSLHTKLNASGAAVFSESYIQATTTTPITSLQSTGLWPTEKPARPTLLMNFSGGYSDETVAAGLGASVLCSGVTTGDYDNDMDLDLYLACGSGASNTPNILYQNQGNGTFVALANTGGAAGPVGIAVGSGAGTADTAITADFDVDGFLDLFVTNGLALRPLYYGGPNTLFRNEGSNGNRWVEIDLVGTTSGREAVGARIYAIANGVTQFREQNGGYHRWSQDARRAHFGLAGAATVTLRVEWPNGGPPEIFPDMPADTLYRITQGTGIAPVQLGDAPAYPCGPTTLDPLVDSGVFIWRDCPSGEWRLKTVSGGTNKTYEARVISSANFASVTPVGLTGEDNLDSTTNPKVIDFSFQTNGSDTDGVNFDVADGSSNCLDIDAPSGTQVYIGPLRAPIAEPFDLDTQGECVGVPSQLAVSPVQVSETAGQAEFAVTLTPAASQTVTVQYATVDGSATAGQDFTGVSDTLTFNPGETSLPVVVPVSDDALAEGNETFTLGLSSPVNAILATAQATGTIQDDEVSPCDTPTYNAGVTRAAFLWRNCTTGAWSVRFTSGGSPTVVTYTGTLVADANFSSVALVNVETADTVDTSNPLQVSFVMKMNNAGFDGFNFSLPVGATACFNTSLPGAAQVLVGAGKVPVTVPFRLDTLGPC